MPGPDSGRPSAARSSRATVRRTARPEAMQSALRLVAQAMAVAERSMATTRPSRNRWQIAATATPAPQPISSSWSPGAGSRTSTAQRMRSGTAMAAAGSGVGQQAGPLLLHVDVGLGPGQLHVLQLLGQQAGDRPVAVPLAVGRDPVPGGGVAVAALQGGHVRLLVLGPEGPLVDVAGVELPVLGRVVEPGQQPLALLLLGDVQEHLDDPDAAL